MYQDFKSNLNKKLNNRPKRTVSSQSFYFKNNTIPILSENFLCNGNYLLSENYNIAIHRNLSLIEKTKFISKSIQLSNIFEPYIAGISKQDINISIEQPINSETDKDLEMDFVIFNISLLTLNIGEITEIINEIKNQYSLKLNIDISKIDIQLFVGFKDLFTDENMYVIDLSNSTVTVEIKESVSNNIDYKITLTFTNIDFGNLYAEQKYYVKQTFKSQYSTLLSYENLHLSSYDEDHISVAFIENSKIEINLFDENLDSQEVEALIPLYVNNSYEEISNLVNTVFDSVSDTDQYNFNVTDLDNGDLPSISITTESEDTDIDYKITFTFTSDIMNLSYLYSSQKNSIQNNLKNNINSFLKYNVLSPDDFVDYTANKLLVIIDTENNALIVKFYVSEVSQSDIYEESVKEQLEKYLNENHDIILNNIPSWLKVNTNSVSLSDITVTQIIDENSDKELSILYQMDNFYITAVSRPSQLSLLDNLVTEIDSKISDILSEAYSSHARVDVKNGNQFDEIIVDIYKPDSSVPTTEVPTLDKTKYRKKHLIILSGQSNMEYLDLDGYRIPTPNVHPSINDPVYDGDESFYYKIEGILNRDDSVTYNDATQIDTSEFFANAHEHDENKILKDKVSINLQEWDQNISGFKAKQIDYKFEYYENEFMVIIKSSMGGMPIRYWIEPDLSSDLSSDDYKSYHIEAFKLYEHGDSSTYPAWKLDAGASLTYFNGLVSSEVVNGESGYETFQDTVDSSLNSYYSTNLSLLYNASSKSFVVDMADTDSETKNTLINSSYKIPNIKNLLDHLNIPIRIKNKEFETFNFIWCQGESDHNPPFKMFQDMYKRSFIKLHKQLSDDLGIDSKELNVVNARLGTLQTGLLSTVNYSLQLYQDSWDAIKNIQTGSGEQGLGKLINNYEYVDTDAFSKYELYHYNFDGQKNLVSGYIEKIKAVLGI